MRKLIPPKKPEPSVKDENGIYTKAPEAVKPSAPDIGPIADIDAASMLHKAMGIMSQEIKNLQHSAGLGKLTPTDARDLCTLVRLLHELVKDERSVLDDMSEEDLEQLLKDRRDKTEP